MYIHKQDKPLRIMSQLPMDENMYLRMRMLRWKATDQYDLPDVSISDYDWESKDGITSSTYYDECDQLLLTGKG